ncbi:hypothetical protein ACWENR_26520 [Micromonospora sp. NPDC004336]
MINLTELAVLLIPDSDSGPGSICRAATMSRRLHFSQCDSDYGRRVAEGLGIAVGA